MLPPGEADKPVSLAWAVRNRTLNHAAESSIMNLRDPVRDVKVRGHRYPNRESVSP
jgi:hypothetical protein